MRRKPADSVGEIRGQSSRWQAGFLSKVLDVGLEPQRKKLKMDFSLHMKAKPPGMNYHELVSKVIETREAGGKENFLNASFLLYLLPLSFD